MGEKISSFLENDSVFGRIMTKCGIIISANIMFIVFCLPIITSGAAYTALNYVCLKAIKDDGEINPFKEFIRSFKLNFKLSTIGELLLVSIGIILYVDIKVCSFASNGVAVLKYPIYAIAFLLVMFAVCFFPTLATFEGKLKTIIKNSLFFMLKNPIKTSAIAIINILPIMFMYYEQTYKPLYAFAMFFFWFGSITMVSAKHWIREYRIYLSN